MTKVTRKISIRLDASLHDKLVKLAVIHPKRSMTAVIAVEQGTTSSPPLLPVLVGLPLLESGKVAMVAMVATARHCRDAIMLASMDPRQHFNRFVHMTCKASSREGRDHLSALGNGDHARGNKVDSADSPPPHLPSRRPMCPPDALQKEGKKISRMDRCRTHRFPAHSALRFLWAESLSMKEAMA